MMLTIKSRSGETVVVRLEGVIDELAIETDIRDLNVTFLDGELTVVDVTADETVIQYESADVSVVVQESRSDTAKPISEGEPISGTTPAENEPIAAPGNQRVRPADSVLDGGEQVDILIGDDRSNQISGLANDDVLWGRGSFDRLSGGSGSDRLYGDSGADWLYGDSGSDVLVGGSGSDYLQGDGGRDRLVGGSGRDQFAIQIGKGRDVIQDYQDGQDKLALFDFTEIGFEQLELVQQGSDTLIRFDDRTLAVLKNIDVEAITSADFTVPLPAIA